MYYINDTLLFLIFGMLTSAMLLVMVAIKFEESSKKLTKVQATVILFVVLVCLFGVGFIIGKNIKRNSKIVGKSKVTSTEPTTYQTTVIDGIMYKLSEQPIEEKIEKNFNYECAKIDEQRKANSMFISQEK